MLTLFAELLRRHSGHPELVVGTAVGNRPQGFESAVGMFVNTVPLRLRLDPAAPGTEAVDEVTDVLFRALPHQDVPVRRRSPPPCTRSPRPTSPRTPPRSRSAPSCPACGCTSWTTASARCRPARSASW
ncbi:condensation domain-containing protein [Kitasatospora sp. A2-31]|uniref:condensation domain-containing protein n=1 Tax=Kitasatospora sp. A2-31 TaxID=2916414 RepID=UPI0027E256BD|nr:condensation domain-containing protein [Kitasatospora sp. A2-31]